MYRDKECEEDVESEIEGDEGWVEREQERETDRNGVESE